MRFTSIFISALAFSTASAYSIKGALNFVRDVADVISPDSSNSSSSQQPQPIQPTQPQTKQPAGSQPPSGSGPSNSGDSQKEVVAVKQAINQYISELFDLYPAIPKFIYQFYTELTDKSSGSSNSKPSGPGNQAPPTSNDKRELGSGPILPPPGYRPSGRRIKSFISKDLSLRHFAKKVISKF